MTKSKIFLYFCLSFIGGIFLNSISFVSKPIFLLISISGIFLISVFWKYKKLAVIGFCFLFLAAGIWRHQQVQSKIVYPEKENIIFIGMVSSEPNIRDNSAKLKIKSEKLKILVTTSRYPEYHYGDKLKISGLLQPPQEFSAQGGPASGWDYKNYLAKDGIFAVMNWPKIELISQGEGNPITALLVSFKNRFQETTEKFVPSPQIGILEALFSGDESNISEEWKEKFNITGTRHIAAVSGMNITIIAFLIMSFSISAGLSRKYAFYLSILLLFLYISMIGAPASAVRAGIMAFILMTAQFLGRPSSALRAVVFAAALMLAINPLLLKFDIGFQLSFLAILGLVYLQPILFKWLRKIPDPKLFQIRTTLSATLAAQFFTLPVLIYNFSYFSFLSPIANLLIVPFLAPITILIFIFGLAAIVFAPLGYLLSWPVWLSLAYITTIIDWFSRLQ